MDSQSQTLLIVLVVVVLLLIGWMVMRKSKVSGGSAPPHASYMQGLAPYSVSPCMEGCQERYPYHRAKRYACEQSCRGPN